MIVNYKTYRAARYNLRVEGDEMSKQNQPKEFEIVNEWNYIWKTPTKIETLNAVADVCPYCRKPLTKGCVLVPIGGEKKAKVSGRECRHCEILFVGSSKAIRKLLQNNERAKEITLNGEYLWNYSYMRRREEQQKCKQIIRKEKSCILSRVSGSLMLVTLKADKEQIDCVITNKKEQPNIPGVIITHYTSRLAREIITSKYHSSRNIKYNEKDYKVRGVYYPSSGGKTKIFPPELKPDEILIKAGGGMSTSVKNNRYEIIDVLLFSPFTQLYELARVTHNRIDDEYFMDICIYRTFVKNYGNPGLHFNVGERSFGKRSFDELRSESILHIYGYSASKNNGLTESQRQGLLAEMVDLNLLETQQIVYHIDFCIKSHTSDDDIYARQKWEKDKNFILNYKVNPNRFLIVKSRDEK